MQKNIIAGILVFSLAFSPFNISIATENNKQTTTIKSSINIQNKKQNSINTEKIVSTEITTTDTKNKQNINERSLSDEPIRIGLLFGDKVKRYIYFSPREGPVEVGYFDKETGEFYPIIKISQTNAYYLIKYDEFKSIKLSEFDNIENAKLHYQKMKKKGYKTYYKFGDDKIEIWICASEDETYLNNVLQNIKKEYPNAKIVTPSNRSIVVKSEYDLIFDTQNKNRNLRLKEVIVNGKRSPIKISEKGGLKYIGYLEFIRQKKGIMLINELSLDEYLYGVVPYEMTDSWPLEALKAQAVVARSYAYNQRYKYKKYGFNVDDTTNCQVFYGYNEKKVNSIKAVNETRGLFITYNGYIIPAFFSSTAGDYTMSNAQVWGGKELPYLKSKRNEYDYLSPRYRWAYESVIYGKDKYFRDGLINTLQNKGYKANNGKYLTNVDEIKLEYFKSSEGVNTRVRRVYIYDKNRNYVTLTGGRFLFLFYDTRRLLPSKEKFWSSYFRISSDASVEIMNAKGYIQEKHGGLRYLNIISANNKVYTLNDTGNSEYVILSKNGERIVKKNMQNITYNGQGWGHGVGMSQWGAHAMAKKGFKFDEILKYYYTGVQIERK